MEDSWIIRGREKFMRITETLFFGSGRGMEWEVAPRMGGVTMSTSLLVLVETPYNMAVVAQKL